MGRKLPVGWIDRLNLGDIFNFNTKSKRKAGDGKNKGNYKFITSSQEIKKFADEADYVNGEYLVFGTGGSTSIHYMNEDFSTSSDNFIITIEDYKKKFNEGLETKFVYYYLEANRKIFDEGFTGSGIKHIGKDYIKNIKFLAPKERIEQQKIVDYLDKQFEFIDAMEKEVITYEKKLDELEKGILEEALKNKKYKQIKLKNLIDLNYGKSISGNLVDNGKVPVYGSNGIYGYTNENPTVNFDTIVVGRKGSVGETIKIKSGSWVSDTAFYVGFKEKPIDNDGNKLDKIDLNFLYYYTKTFEKTTMGQGVKPGVNRDVYLDFEIYHPDINTQKSIAYKLDKQFELINSTRQEIINQKQNLKILRKAMLHDIFGGFEE